MQLYQLNSKVKTKLFNGQIRKFILTAVVDPSTGSNTVLPPCIDNVLRVKHELLIMRMVLRMYSY